MATHRALPLCGFPKACQVDLGKKVSNIRYNDNCSLYRAATSPSFLKLKSRDRHEIGVIGVAKPKPTLSHDRSVASWPDRPRVRWCDKPRGEHGDREEGAMDHEETCWCTCANEPPLSRVDELSSSRLFNYAYHSR